MISKLQSKLSEPSPVLAELDERRAEFVAVSSELVIEANKRQNALADSVLSGQLGTYDDSYRLSLMQWATDLRQEDHDTVQYAVDSVSDAGGLAEAVFAKFIVELRYLAGPQANSISNWYYLGGGLEDASGLEPLEGIMLDLFDAILLNDRASYVISLGRMAALFSRLSPLEAAFAAGALADALNNTMEFFGWDSAVARILFNATLNAMTIAVDAAKYVGFTPAQEYVAGSIREYSEVAGEPSSLVRIAGFWLWEPSSQRLVRVRTCEAFGAEPCVSIVHTLQALTDPYRLGIGACSLQEMVTDGLVESAGYMCSRGACAESPGMDFLSTIGKTQYGVPLDNSQGLLCGGIGAGGVGTGGALSSQLALCALSVNGPSLRETLFCLADAQGDQSSPFTQEAIPALPEADCARMDGGGISEEDNQKLEAAKEKAKAELDKRKEALKKEANRQYTGMDMTEEDIDAAKKAIDNANINTACGKGVTACAGGTTINLPASTVERYDAEMLGRILAHESVHVAVNSAGGEDALWGEAIDHLIMKHTGFYYVKGSEVGMCAPEMGCSNECGVDNERIRKTLQCLTEENPMDAVRPPDYGVIDPSPLDPSDGAWDDCFLAGDPEGTGASVGARCGAIDCGPGSYPDLACQCVEWTAGPSGPVTDRTICHYVRCAGYLTSVDVGGTCGCLGEGASMMDSLVPIDELDIQPGILYPDPGYEQ